MPSASDFDTAAELFERAAASSARWAVGTRACFGVDTLSGGLLTDVCHQAVDAAEQAAASAAGALRAQASLCRQRAAAVRTYQAAIADYRTAHNRWREQVNDLPEGLTPPRSPQPPTKPSFVD